MSRIKRVAIFAGVLVVLFGMVKCSQWSSARKERAEAQHLQQIRDARLAEQQAAWATKGGAVTSAARAAYDAGDYALVQSTLQPYWLIHDPGIDTIRDSAAAHLKTAKEIEKLRAEAAALPAGDVQRAAKVYARLHQLVPDDKTYATESARYAHLAGALAAARQHALHALAAQKLEESMLSAGINARVALDPKNDTVVIISYALASKALAYQLSHQRDVMRLLRDGGITAAVLTDHRSSVWSFGTSGDSPVHGSGQ